MNQDYRRDDLNVPDFMREKTSERRNTSASQTSSRRRTRQEDYEELRRKSTTGKSARRTRDKKIETTHKNSRKRIKKALFCAAIGAALTIGGFKAAHNIENELVVNQEVNEFYTEVMSENRCHLSPTEENSNNWGYLHDKISIDIEEKGYDYDEALFLFSQNLEHNKDWNMDQLIRFSGQYKDYQDFLSQNGYETSEDFKKAMKKKIVLESEIDEKNRQLSEMNDELESQRMQASNSTDMSIGGK